MKIEVNIAGTTPLLMNRFRPENELQISAGTSRAMVGTKDRPREEARKRAYMDDDGNLYVPGPNIFSCLIAAGKFHKVGKSKVPTRLKLSNKQTGHSTLLVVTNIKTRTDMPESDFTVRALKKR